MPATPADDRRFQAALKHLLKHEGGYVNHPSDPGGATNLGVSLRWLRDEGRFDRDRDGWPDGDLDRDGDIDRYDVRGLTRADAERLYYDHWWLRGFGGAGDPGFGALPQPVGEKLFDIAVNAGRTRAAILLQRGLATSSTVAVDGIVGPKTRAAVVAACSRTNGALALTRAIAAHQRAFYMDLARRNPSMTVFLRGWLSRADYLAT